MEYQRIAITGQAIVVAFDMCSSSNIIEDLTNRKNVQPPTTFLDELKRYLAKVNTDAPWAAFRAGRGSPVTLVH